MRAIDDTSESHVPHSPVPPSHAAARAITTMEAAIACDHEHPERVIARRSCFLSGFCVPLFKINGGSRGPRAARVLCLVRDVVRKKYMNILANPPAPCRIGKRPLAPEAWPAIESRAACTRGGGHPPQALRVAPRSGGDFCRI